MFTDPNTFFNNSQVNESLALVVNGTMTPGHFEVIAQVPGLDILISLAIIQTVMIFFLLAYAVLGRNLRRVKLK